MPNITGRTPRSRISYTIYEKPIRMKKKNVPHKFSGRKLLVIRNCDDGEYIKIFASFDSKPGWPLSYYLFEINKSTFPKKIDLEDFEFLIVHDGELINDDRPIKVVKKQDENIYIIDDDEPEEEDTPSVISEIRKWLDNAKYLDFYNAVASRVKGQKELSLVTTNVYHYLKNIVDDKKCKNNTIIAAPSGCGKTETYRAISDYFKREIPSLVVHQVDSSILTPEGFRGHDVDEIIRPMEHANSDGIGIVFLDEFDKKLVPERGSRGDDFNLSLQNQLLTLIEGQSFSDIHGKVDTNNTLFIAMGSFDACRQKKSQSEKHIGFEGGNTPGEDHYADITREDIINLGGTYELIGRFGTVVNYQKLSDEVIDCIIDDIVDNMSKEYGCEVVISKRTREYLHGKANSEFGCRLLNNQISDGVLKGYSALIANNEEVGDFTIFLEDECVPVLKPDIIGENLTNQNICAIL